MLKHPEDIVITFDDDFFYPLDSIEKVYEIHDMFPEDVVGASIPIFSKHNIMDPLNWKMLDHVATHENNLGICSGACTLYPPHALHKNAFDPEAIRKLSPLADDLWLTAMTYMNGRKISGIGRLPFPISVQDTQKCALTSTNNSAKSEINNNTQWAAILDCYKDELEEWMESVN